MTLSRLESNVATGEVTSIPQKAYRNEEGLTIALDSTAKAPEGYEEFDPSVGKDLSETPN